MSTGNGKPQYLQEAHWSQTFCPILTAARLSRPVAPPSPLVGPTVLSAGVANKPEEPEAEVVGCFGPQCQFFTIIRDEHGNGISGKCSQALTPMLGDRIAQGLNMLTKVMSGGTVMAGPPGAEEVKRT